MPYMEAINFLSFLRENMLLATVVDSFCLNNTKHFFKKWNDGKGVRLVFGRLMGGLSFFLQDFPQFTIHACFKIFYATPEHYALKKEPLLLISMFVSGCAVLISLFNLVMCRENDFDPVDLEAALHKRRGEVIKRKEKEAAEQAKLDEALKRTTTKKEEVHFKRRMQDAFRKKLL